LITLHNLIDEQKCYAQVRQIRWANGLKYPKCGSDDVIRNGHDHRHPGRQRYQCHGCRANYDDLTDTVFEGHHQPLKVWMLSLYLMGLNLSNRQIGHELGLNKDDFQHMTMPLRRGIVLRQPRPTLQDKVECDEVYIVAGHKGQPSAVEKKGALDAETD
jgi:transposase-like protein